MEQLVGRRRDVQRVEDSGQTPELVNLLAAAYEAEPSPVLLRTLVRAHEDAESRRVHELQTPQVNDDALDTGLPRSLKLRLELWRRGKVKLSGRYDDRGLILAAYS